MGLLDHEQPSHQRALQRLDTELIAWLTTVSRDGQPSASPVWFVFDPSDETFLIFSRPSTGKLRNIAANPLVCLHLDGNGQGGDIVSLDGRAELVDGPAYDQVPRAVDKYAGRREAMGYTPEGFAADYSQTIRVAATRIRAW